MWSTSEMARSSRSSSTSTATAPSPTSGWASRTPTSEAVPEQDLRTVDPTKPCVRNERPVGPPS
jgi:hypothetical protein